MDQNRRWVGIGRAYHYVVATPQQPESGVFEPPRVACGTRLRGDYIHVQRFVDVPASAKCKRCQRKAEKLQKGRQENHTRAIVEGMERRMQRATRCQYPNCHRPAHKNHTTCARHFSAGRCLAQDRMAKKRGMPVVEKQRREAPGDAQERRPTDTADALDQVGRAVRALSNRAWLEGNTCMCCYIWDLERAWDAYVVASRRVEECVWCGADLAEEPLRCSNRRGE